MLRQFGGSFAVLALLAGGFVLAQDRGDRKADQGRETKSAQAGNDTTRLRFDLDNFIKDHDKNHDGYLSREELPPRLRHYFDQIDTDKDGRLSRAELERGVVYLQQRRRPSDVVFVLIEMSDCDECCAEELQQVYDTLRKLDKNQDGKIDASELRTAREQLVQQRVDNLLKELDADKDGRISREEAKGMVRRHFDRLDTNHDGFIDREELLKAAAEAPQGSQRPAAPNKNTAKEPRR
jgi:Ca2+-binding EF-hand superfamily protein